MFIIYNFSGVFQDYFFHYSSSPTSDPTWVSTKENSLRQWGAAIVKYMRNTSEQLDIRQLLFCLITLANVIWDSKDFHPFECICSLMVLTPPTTHSLRSILSENSGTWQLLHPHLPPLGHSRNYIWQMRQGAEAMDEWADGEG